MSTSSSLALYYYGIGTNNNNNMPSISKKAEHNLYFKFDSLS